MCKGWLSNLVKCDLCSNEWAAVYPVECDRLECPNCNNIAVFKVLKIKP